MQMETKSQEEIENINRQIISTETESVFKKKPQQNPGSQGFNAELYQTFRKQLTYILPKTFPKTAEEGMLLTHPMRPVSP